MKKIFVVLLVATLGVMVEAQQVPPWINELPPDGTYWSRLRYSREEAKRWLRAVLKNKGDETFDDEEIADNVDSAIDANKEVKVTR
jgi:hypothetical protein